METRLDRRRRRTGPALALVGGLGLFAAGGCKYGAMEAHNGKLYVARNDFPLFGIRSMWECTPDLDGNLTCVRVEGRP